VRHNGIKARHAHTYTRAARSTIPSRPLCLAFVRGAHTKPPAPSLPSPSPRPPPFVRDLQGTGVPPPPPGTHCAGLAHLCDAVATVATGKKHQAPTMLAGRVAPSASADATNRTGRRAGALAAVEAHWQRNDSRD
jgi:hypothetical protein